jgi:hypothetical protein
MAKSAGMSRNARKLAKHYSTIKAKLRAIDAKARREPPSQEDLSKRNDLYKELNDAKISLISTGYDPERVDGLLAAEERARQRSKRQKQIGLKASRPVGGSKRLGRKSGGVGIYSLGNARKTWR